MAKYLVVHPKMHVKKGGSYSTLKAGEEIALAREEAERLVKQGKLKLVTGKKKAESQDQAEKANGPS